MSVGNYDPMEAGYRQPLSPGYRRPEPWVFTVAPADRFDREGLQHRPGTWAHFEITDQWRGDKQATNLELYQLAADRIPGAGVLMSSKPEYVGNEVADYNKQVLEEKRGDSDKGSYLHYAVVVFGADETQFSEALADVRRDSLRIQAAQDIAAIIDAVNNP